MSDSLRPRGLQHTRLRCPSSTLEACSNSCSLSRWCNLILCHPLLLPPSIFPSIKVFSSESVLHIRWPKYWNISFSISPSSEHSGLPLGLTGLISLQSKGLSRVFFSTTVQKHQFFSAQPSLWSNTPVHDHGKTLALTIWTFLGYVMSLLFNMLSSFVIAFLPRSKCLLIS